MLTHCALDLLGRCVGAGRLALGLNSDAAHVPWVNGPAGHWVPCARNRNLGVAHKEVIVVLESSYEFAEGGLVVVVCTTGGAVLDLIHDCVFWKVERNWVHVICFQNYLRNFWKVCDA